MSLLDMRVFEAVEQAIVESLLGMRLYEVSHTTNREFVGNEGV